MYLNKNTAQTKVKGVNVIYHFENNALAGLSEEASKLLAKIASDPFFKPNLKNKDIRELLQFLMENNFLSIKPFTYKKNEIASAYVHLTNQCNLHCKGCYSFDDKRNTRATAFTFRLFRVPYTWYLLFSIHNETLFQK
ncbi:MAG: hypothetical protein LBF32_01985 [Streptococcaceae bacterium]|jgi:hypothetical protein|nr:hypothetical protein [Streptococcaceae bacterium]